MTFDGNNKSCAYGMQPPMVKEIQGRKLDLLYTVDGAKINTDNVADLFKNIPNALVRTQRIQDTMDEIIDLLEVDKRLYKSG